MDSITLLYDMSERIALAVTFDYGSKHNAREIPFARLHCHRLGIEHLVIPLSFMQQYFQSSLLKGGEEIPEGHYAADNMKSTVVPFRNGIMLSIAAGLAESRGLQYVMMANHSGDHSIYPDCTPQFVEASSCSCLTRISLRPTLRVVVRRWDWIMPRRGAATRAASIIADAAAPVSKGAKHLLKQASATLRSTRSRRCEGTGVRRYGGTKVRDLFRRFCRGVLCNAGAIARQDWNPPSLPEPACRTGGRSRSSSRESRLCCRGRSCR